MSIRIRTAIGSLYQGVSTQPPEDRIKGQVEESVNMWHRIEDSLKRRPPTRNIRDLSSGRDAITKDNLVSVDYDPQSNFLYFVENTTTNSQTDSKISGYSLSDRRKIIRKYTDKTIRKSDRIFNDTLLYEGIERYNRLTLNLSQINAYHGVRQKHHSTFRTQFLLSFRNSQIGVQQELRIYTNAVSGSDGEPGEERVWHYTAGSTTAGLAKTIADSFLPSFTKGTDSSGKVRYAKYLGAQGGDNWFFVFEADQYETTIHIHNALITSASSASDAARGLRGGGIESLETTDIRARGTDDQYGFIVITDGISNLSNLPDYAPLDYHIKVENQEIETPYYLKSVSTIDNKVLWKEAFYSGFTDIESPIKLDNNNNETINYLEDPKVGILFDDSGSIIDIPPIVYISTTNLAPKGNKYNSVLHELYEVVEYRNRAMYLYDGGIQFSETNRPQNIFFTSQTQSFDTDPFGITYPAGDSSVKRAVPFRNSMFLLGARAQYELKSGASGAFSKDSVLLERASSYVANPDVKPAVVGDRLYFVSDIRDTSKIWEYYFSEANLSNTADDIALHVASYLPSNIIYLAGHTASHSLFALSNKEGHKNRIYVYTAFRQGEERVQSAWSHWEIGGEDDEILFIEVVADDLVILIERDGKVYLEGIRLIADYIDEDLPEDILLDSLVSITEAEYDSINGDENSKYTTARLGDKFYKGYAYTSRVKFSPMFPYTGQSQNPTTTGDGFLNSWKLLFSDLGDSKVVLESAYDKREWLFGSPMEAQPKYETSGLAVGKMQDLYLSVETDGIQQMGITRLYYDMMYNDLTIQDNRSR